MIREKRVMSRQALYRPKRERERERERDVVSRADVDALFAYVLALLADGEKLKLSVR